MVPEGPAAKPIPPLDALIIVDVQSDFLPGGALAVPEGDSIVLLLNAWSAAFGRAGCDVYATRDWHPPGHCSFHEQGGPWPAHCVAGTQGAAFPDALELPAGHAVVSKAQDAARDAYSGFDGTDLAQRLRRAGTKRVWIGGLATDYCVRATVLDAIRLGFEVTLLTDCVRAVEATPGDGERALAAMLAGGATFRPGGPEP